MNIASLTANFSLRRFITLCFKYWYIFVITIVGCTALTLAFSFIKKPKSEIFAQLMIKDDTGSSSMLMAGQIARSFSLGDMFGSSSSTDNEAMVMQSHTVFLATAKQLDLNKIYYQHKMPLVWKRLYADAPIELKPVVDIADTLSVILNFRLDYVDSDAFDIKVKVKSDVIAKCENQKLPAKVSTPYGDFIVEKTKHYNETSDKDYKITYTSYNNAASLYSKLVSIYVPDRRSDFINISFVTDAPDFGINVINHVISNYIDLANVYKMQRTSQSLRLVDERLSSLASELLVSEKAIEDFKTKYNITEPEVDAQYLLNKTGMIETSLLQAQTNFEVIKLTREYISNPENNFELIPELLSNTTTQGSGDNSAGLIAQYNKLILERMQLLTTAKSTNASVLQLDQQIDALRANIITSINRLYENAKVALNDLKSENSKNKGRIGELPSIERQYVVLKRDNLLQEQIYLFLLQQREELNMSLASKSLPAQVIDAPYELDEPVGMSRKMLLMMGVFFGGILGALYVLVTKMPTTPLQRLDDLKQMLKAPLLANLSNDDETTITANHANAEPIRTLRGEMMQELAIYSNCNIAVTSMVPNEGKTYIANNLAVSFAKLGRNVRLINLSGSDLNMVSTLSLKGAVEMVSEGLNNYGTGSIGTGNIQYLAIAGDMYNASDVVAHEHFAELLKGHDNIDVTILDFPPIDGTSIMCYLPQIVDITLMVTRAGIANAKEVEKINSIFTDACLPRIGVVSVGFKEI